VSTEGTYTCTCGNVVRIVVENGSATITKIKCRCGMVLAEEQ
jgi:hypothetical protein